MKLEWIGHACFRMTADDGTVVITDPYDESVGVEMLPLEADMVTISHEHHDHCETAMLVGHPRMVRGTQAAQVGGVATRAVASWHDDAQGALRGGNAIRVFDVDGLKIVHMGDQGCMPDEAALQMIADADVMLIPAGGVYTVDAQGAKAIIERTHPRCVIPMHVKTKRCAYPIAPVEPFLEAMGVSGARPVQMLEVSADAPKGVVLMQPLADAMG